MQSMKNAAGLKIKSLRHFALICLICFMIKAWLR